MNSRIKELCEHAKVYATECTKHFTGDEPVVWMDYYTEKFAELIVKECGVALSPMLRDMVSRGQAFDLIKEHFGVEKLT